MARIPQSCIFDYLLLKYKQNVLKILVSRLSTNLKKKKLIYGSQMHFGFTFGVRNSFFQSHHHLVTLDLDPLYDLYDI